MSAADAEFPREGANQEKLHESGKKEFDRGGRISGAPFDPSMDVE